MKGDPQTILSYTLNAELLKIAASRIVGNREITTKEDLRPDVDDELFRLFNRIDKYNRAISDLVAALKGDSPVVNVVAPGYQAGHPASAITDLVIESAMQQPSGLGDDVSQDARTADLNERNARRQRATLAEFELEAFGDPNLAREFNMPRIESSLLGSRAYDRLDRNNFVLQFIREQAVDQAVAAAEGTDADAGEVASRVPEAEVWRRAMTLFGRGTSDLIFNPDVEKSYLYPCQAFSGGRQDNEQLEARGQQQRNLWKSAENSVVPPAVSNAVGQVFAELNVANGLTGNAAFAPYGLQPGTVRAEEIDIGLDKPDVSDAAAVFRWFNDNTDDAAIGLMPEDPGAQAEFFARAFPPRLITWLLNLPQEQRKEVVIQWIRRAAWTYYSRLNVPTAERGAAFSKYVDKIRGTADYDSEEEERTFTGIVPAIITMLRAGVDRGNAAETEAAGSVSLRQLPRFSEVEEALASVHGIGEKERTQARATAAEFVAGRLRNRIASSFGGSGQPMVCEGTVALNTGGSFVEIPLRQLAEFLGVGLDKNISELEAAFAARVQNLVIITDSGRRRKSVERGELNSNIDGNTAISAVEEGAAGTVTVTVPASLGHVPKEQYQLEIPSASLANALYSAEYGNLAERARELHEEYGISINRGPLPNWAPDPYDFRERTSSHVGSPNNLHNVQIALNKRLRLREIYLKKRAMNKKTEGIYNCGLGYLNAEINEIQTFLENGPGAASGAGGRYKLDSLSRYLDNDRTEFYDDVKARAKAKGVTIPAISPLINEEVLEKLLPKGEMEVVRNAFEEAKADWGGQGAPTAWTYFVMKGFDNASVGESNGVLLVSEQPGAEDPGSMTVSKVIDSNFVRMLGEFSQSVTAAQNNRSKLIIVSNDPIGEFKQLKGISIAQVSVPVEAISAEEIEQYVKYFEQNFKGMSTTALRERFGQYGEITAIEDGELVELQGKFFVPSTISQLMIVGMGNMPYSDVRSYVASKVEQIFRDYLLTKGNVSAVLANNERETAEEVKDMQQDNAVARRINIDTTKTPVTRLQDYMTKTGTAWESFIKGAADGEPGLMGSVSEISVLRQKQAAIRRMLDVGVLFVSTRVNRRSRGNQAEGRILFDFVEDTPGKTYWVSTTADRLEDVDPDTETKNMVNVLFGVAPLPISNLIEAEESGGVSIRREVHQKSKTDILRQAAAAIQGLDIKAQAASSGIFHSPFIFLYGDRGSGKTIFAEALANALGLRYQVAKLSEIYSADRATYVGGAQQNLYRLTQYLRNLKDTVFLLDEFHKPFVSDPRLPGTTTRAGEKEVVEASLQTAWENDEAIYKENNVFIVLTSNARPDEIDSSALMDRVKLQYRVEVPTDFRDLTSYFADGASAEMLIAKYHAQDADLVRSLIAAHEKNQVETFDATLRKIVEKNRTATLHKGFLYPNRGRRNSIARQGVDIGGHETVADLAHDLAEGWLMVKRIFAEMTNDQKMIIDGRRVTMSPLKASMLKLERNMQMVPEAESVARGRETVLERTAFSAASYRNLNEMLVVALKDHQRFLEGASGAIPLNYVTLWISSNLCVWNDEPEELARMRIDTRERPGDAQAKELYRRLSDERRFVVKDGWSQISSVLNSPAARASGLSPDILMTGKDIKYQMNMLREAVNLDPSFSQDKVADRKAGITNLAITARMQLRPNLAAYDHMLDNNIGLLQARPDQTDRNLAKFLGLFKVLRNRVLEASENYLRGESEETADALMKSLRRFSGLMKVGGERRYASALAERASSVLASSTTKLSDQSINQWITQQYAAGMKLAKIVEKHIGSDLDVFVAPVQIEGESTEEFTARQQAANQAFESYVTEKVEVHDAIQRKTLWDTVNQFSAFKDITFEEVTDPDLIAYARDLCTLGESEEELPDIADMTDEEFEAYMAEQEQAEISAPREKAEPESEDELDLEDLDTGARPPAEEPPVAGLPAPPSSEDLLKGEPPTQRPPVPEGGEIQPTPEPEGRSEILEVDPGDPDAVAAWLAKQRKQQEEGKSSSFNGMTSLAAERIELVPDFTPETEAKNFSDHLMAHLERAKKQKEKQGEKPAVPEKPQKKAQTAAPTAPQGLDLGVAADAIGFYRNAQEIAYMAEKRPLLSQSRGMIIITMPPSSKDFSEE